MDRFKIMGSTLILIITLLIVSAYIPVGTEEVKGIIADAEIISNNNIADKEELQRHQLFQKKLRVALQEYFKKAIASGEIVGAGVSIVYRDSILISNGFGKRNINKNSKVDGETVFRLGSLSKGFAGILMASLRSEGKLDWDDKIVDHIPEFEFGDSLNTQKIELSHILSHTSGTPYHSYTNLVEAGIPVEEIAKRFNEVKPISEPGAMYSYQNAMFSLSQEVILNATGKDVKTLLENRFFKPLGMTTTSMEHNELIKEKNVALPHTKRINGWRSLPLTDKYYNAVVAGGINASSLDMAKWMRSLLGHNPEVLKTNTIKQVFTPFVEIEFNNKYYQRWPNHIKSHYGFGWRIHTLKNQETKREKTVWHHGGSVNNYRNEIALYPGDDLGICVLLNGNSRLAQTVIPDLYGMISDVYKDIYPEL